MRGAVLLAALAGAAAAPFTPGNLVALRVGEVGSTATLTTSAFPAALVEVDPATSAVVQTIPLPTTNTSTTGRCTQSGSSNLESHMSLSADGFRLIVPCYNAPLGTSTLTGNVRSVAVVTDDGSVDTSLVFTTSASESNRGATAAVVGGALRVYLATSNGVKMVTHGSPAFTPAVALTSTGSVRAAAIFGGALYTTTGTSPYGLANVLNGPPLPSAAPASLATVATMVLPGTSAAWLYVNGFWFQDESTLWLGNYFLTGTYGYLLKMTNIGGTWTMAPGYPKSTVTFTAPGTGLPVSAQGLKSLTGGADPVTGEFVLYSATYTTTSGANFLVKYNTVTETWTALLQSPAMTQYAGMAWAPRNPSPTSSLTPSMTPSRTPTPSATGTEGASPSSTPSGTASPSGTGTPSPSVSPTRSQTATPTATPSALCAPDNAAPRHLSPGSLVVVRVGSGRNPLTTSNVPREVWVDEFDPLDGTRLQSFPLPAGGAVTNATTGEVLSAGCVMSGGTTDTGFLTRSADGAAVLLPCIAEAVSLSATLPSTAVKTVTALLADGSTRVLAAHAFSTGAYRAVAAANISGGPVYFTSASGVHVLAGGGGRSAGPVQTAQTVASGTWRGLAWLGGGLHAVQASTTSAVSLVGGLAHAAAPPTVSPAPTALPLPGFTTGASTSAFVVFEDALTAYMTDGTAVAHTLSKWTRPTAEPTAAWTRAWTKWGTNYTTLDGAPGFVVGARGAVGRVIDGDFHLFMATNAGLIRYNTATDVAVLLAAACDNTQMRGVAWAPDMAPSPSVTPSSSQTASPSATGSTTRAPGVTPSATSSLTPSSSATSSLSATATVTPSASLTASNTPSNSPTPSITPSATPTAACPGLLNNVPMRSNADDLGALNGSFPAIPRVGSIWSHTSGTITTTCPGYATLYAAPTGTDVYMVDLRAHTPGGTLTISTCNHPGLGLTGWTGDNHLHVFTSCPSGGVPPAGCAGANDQGGAQPFGACSSLAHVVVSPTAHSVYYAVAGQWSTSVWSAGMHWSYIPPTPSGTPSPTGTTTPSNTGTPTSSSTAGASPSITASGTGSVSATSSVSSSRTPSQTPSSTPAPMCNGPTASPAPFAATSIVALRVGDGRAAFPTTAVAVPAFLDELDPATGELLQTIALPVGPVVAGPDGAIVAAGVTCPSTVVDTCLIARSADGARLVVPGHAVAPGATIATTANKTVWEVDGWGAGTLGAVHAFSTSAFRSAATVDGSRYWMSTASGVLTLPRGGAAVATPVNVMSTVARSLEWWGGGLYATTTSTTAAVSLVGGLVAVSGPPPTASPAPTAYALPGTGTGLSTTSSIAWESDTVLWALDLASPVASLWRFTRPSADPTAVWARSPGFPRWGVNFTDDSGVPRSTSGGRGLTGVTLGGAFHLVLAAAEGIVRVNTVTGEGTLLATPCPATQWRSLDRAPVAPSATASATSSRSATPSNTATPTASATFGATASSTASGTPTPSGTGTASPSGTGTGTGTPTPSPSPSALCAPDHLPPQPFTPGSLVALRLGDGRSPLSSTNVAEAGFLDEYDPATGAVLQSIRLPTGPLRVDPATGAPLPSSGCAFSASAADTGALARSVDGRSVCIACHALQRGETVASTATKPIVCVGTDGALEVPAVHAFSTGTYRSVLTVDGSRFWFTTASGLQSVPRGNNATTAAVTLHSGTFRGMAVWDGGLYLTVASTTSTVSLAGGAPGATAFPSASPAPTVFPLPGVLTGVSTAASTVFAPDGLTLWVLDLTSPVVSLARFTRPTASLAATWVRSAGFPRWGVNATTPGGGVVTVPGGRGATGWTDPATGVFHLVWASDAGLIRYNTATDAAVVLAAACPMTTLRSVALAPTVLPSPTPSPSGTPPTTPTTTPTPSGTGTPTATGSPSGTRTAVPTRSGTGTPTATASVTATRSASATGSASATASETSSVSATATETSSVSASQTGTSSPSGTQTGTPSPSGTQTGTPSPSGTQTGTPSPSGTQTGTPSPAGTQSPTSTPPPTGTSSLSGTPTASGTATKSRAAVAATRSRTASATRSRTRTRSRSRSGTRKRKQLLRQ